MQKRALIFSLAYDPFWGGAEVAIREITNRLGEGYTFDLITARLDRDTPSTEVLGNITLHRVGFGKRNPSPADLLRLPWYLSKVFYPPLSFFRASFLILKNRPDFLWAVMSYTAIGASLASFIFRLPLLITLQEGDTPEHMFKRARLKPFVPLVRLAFRRASVVQAISLYLAGLAKELGFRGEPVVIPNGVDNRLLSAVNRTEVADLKEQLQIPKNLKVLVTTSRLVEKNGVEYIIRSLPKLEGWFLVIVGDGPLYPNLESLVRVLGLSERVRFVGAVSHQVVPVYLKLGDVFVRPSLSEGLGISFLEAMAAGVPVVATQVGGIKDFMFDPELNPERKPTGRAVPPKDPEAIARAVRLYLENPELTEQIRANARKLALDYDWSIVSGRMRGLLDKLS